MTLLAENPDVWDIVFRESGARVRFVEKLISDAGTRVLDVGCATGALCAALRRRGARSFGLDLNPRFVEAARANDPGGEYEVGDMRSFRLGRRFDLLICLGTTFAYNLTNDDIAETLASFRAHLKPGGRLVIDVLNAIAFTGPRPFRVRTQHTFARKGFHATATIRHRLNPRTQTMTEQVSWKLKGQPLRRDPEESLRAILPTKSSRFSSRSGGIPCR